MTAEREMEIRAACERTGFDRIDPGDSPGEMMRDLLAEVDRLRRLPVIATCGECRWCHATEVCMHPRAHAESEIDGCAMPPPDWCPLRGER